MNNSVEISNVLKNEFLQEASNAPKLFKNCAKGEHYINDSYETRSFVELIQNADDAKSIVFGIRDVDRGLIVANNGRPFIIEAGSGCSIVRPEADGNE